MESALSPPDVGSNGTDHHSSSGLEPQDQTQQVESDQAGTGHRQQSGHALLRRIATYAPGSLIPAALTLATSLIFTRIFDAVDYGLFSLVLVVATMAKTGFTVWLTQSIAKFLPPEQELEGQRRVKEAIFLSVWLIITVEALIGIGILAFGRGLVAVDVQEFLLPAVIFVIVSSTFDVLSAIFPAQHRAREYVGYQLFTSLSTLAFRLLLVSALFEMDIALMFWSVVISNALVLPVMWVKCDIPAPGRLFTALRSKSATSLTVVFGRYGMPMTLWVVAGLLLDVGDRFVINYFQGPEAVGIYDANYRLIVGFVSLMIVPVTITLHPYLMSISGSGLAGHIGHVIGVIVENLLLLGTLAVGLTAVFHNEIALLLGPSFRSGSSIMPVVLAGVFAFNIGTFVHKPFEIIGRTGPMVVFAYLAAVINLAVNFALVPVMGYFGSAVATLIAYVAYTLAAGKRGRRIFPWRLDGRSTARFVGIIVVVVSAIAGMRWLLAGSAEVLGLILAVLASTVLGLWVLAIIRRGVLSVPEIGHTATVGGRENE